MKLVYLPIALFLSFGDLVLAKSPPSDSEILKLLKSSSFFTRDCQGQLALNKDLPYDESTELFRLKKGSPQNPIVALLLTYKISLPSERGDGGDPAYEKLMASPTGPSKATIKMLSKIRDEVSMGNIVSAPFASSCLFLISFQQVDKSWTIDSHQTKVNPSEFIELRGALSYLRSDASISDVPKPECLLPTVDEASGSAKGEFHVFVRLYHLGNFFQGCGEQHQGSVGFLFHIKNSIISDSFDPITSRWDTTGCPEAKTIQNCSVVAFRSEKLKINSRSHSWSEKEGRWRP